MLIGRFLFLAFLLIPIAEIYVLIQVGSAIGTFQTIALIIFTALLGSVLIRAQGLATLARVRGSLGRGEVPAVEMMEGVCLLIAGALLLTPGFVTDTFGFLLLIPVLRRAVILGLLERGVLRAASATAYRPGTGPRPDLEAGAGEAHPSSAPGPENSPNHRPGGGRIIEGEFERED